MRLELWPGESPCDRACFSIYLRFNIILGIPIKVSLIYVNVCRCNEMYGTAKGLKSYSTYLIHIQHHYQLRGSIRCENIFAKRCPATGNLEWTYASDEKQDRATWIARAGHVYPLVHVARRDKFVTRTVRSRDAQRRRLCSSKVTETLNHSPCPRKLSGGPSVTQIKPPVYDRHCYFPTFPPIRGPPSMIVFYGR